MMMKITSRWPWMALPVITVGLCAAYVGIGSWQKTHFACDAQLTMVDRQGADDVIMHFRFAGKTGHIETKGKYAQDNGEVIQTSNKVDFSFWLDGDALMLVANETNRIPKIAPPEIADVPDFFTARESGIRMQIVRKNANGYLFFYDGAPALYCKITD